MEYQIGVDTGGTFTDCVVVDQGGKVTQAKALTTPRDFSEGFLEAVRGAADKLDLSVADLLGNARRIVYGSTIAINTLIQRRGTTTGLFATRGFEDTILIMRAIGRVDGLDEEEIQYLAIRQKPEPIVPRYLIEGIRERIDYKGAVVTPLNEDDVRAAARRLVEKGVRSFAVCLMWGFANPSHEQRIKEILHEMYSEIPCSTATEVSPVLGEYERTATTVVNAYLTPMVLQHILKLNGLLRERGLRSPLLLMQSAGGCITLQEGETDAA